MLGIDPPGLDGVMLDGARAFLRVDGAAEDALLGELLLAAIEFSEGFTGQMLLRRQVREIHSAGSGWQTLLAGPVAEVTGVTGIPAEGARFALAADAWEAKVSSNGEGYLRVLRPGSAGRVEVAYSAGLAADWEGLPHILRLALLRLAAHFHAHRDAAQDAGPPHAVTALLRPWRRMRLT